MVCTLRSVAGDCVEFLFSSCIVVFSHDFLLNRTPNIWPLHRRDTRTPGHCCSIILGAAMSVQRDTDQSSSLFSLVYFIFFIFSYTDSPRPHSVGRPSLPRATEERMRRAACCWYHEQKARVCQGKRRETKGNKGKRTEVKRREGERSEGKARSSSASPGIMCRGHGAIRRWV